MTEHTATPWEKDYGNTYGHIKSLGVEGHTPTVCKYDWNIGNEMNPLFSKEQKEANAEFIVKACNSYESNQQTIKELVEALEGVVSAEWEGNTFDVFPEFEPVWNKALEALERAKGGMR